MALIWPRRSCRNDRWLSGAEKHEANGFQMESSRVDSNLVFLVELETPTAQHKVVNCSVTYVYIHIFIYSFICLYIYIYIHAQLPYVFHVGSFCSLCKSSMIRYLRSGGGIKCRILVGGRNNHTRWSDHILFPGASNGLP